MRRQTFHNQLVSASFQALTFGQQFVKNNLQINLKYLVHLNQSSDDSKNDDEVTYPEDKHRIEILDSSAAVVELLCRDGKCPQWIDIAIFGCDQHATLLKLECCGRYHDDEKRMYYFANGTQPFGVKGPYLRPWLIGSQKFQLPSIKSAINSDKKGVHAYSISDRIRSKIWRIKTRFGSGLA